MRRAPTLPPPHARAGDRVIGRDADLDALELEVARSPVVTVLGPPGVGKTRLAGAPELCIVVTSRARLRVPGEVVFDLAPLALAAAAELFVERARKVRREPVEHDAAIIELVRRLDGMPLAIELAAARSRLFEP